MSLKVCMEASLSEVPTAPSPSVSYVHRARSSAKRELEQQPLTHEVVSPVLQSQSQLGCAAVRPLNASKSKPRRTVGICSRPPAPPHLPISTRDHGPCDAAVDMVTCTELPKRLGRLATPVSTECKQLAERLSLLVTSLTQGCAKLKEWQDKLVSFTATMCEEAFSCLKLSRRVVLTLRLTANTVLVVILSRLWDFFFTTYVFFGERGPTCGGSFKYFFSMV